MSSTSGPRCRRYAGACSTSFLSTKRCCGIMARSHCSTALGSKRSSASGAERASKAWPVRPSIRGNSIACTGADSCHTSGQNWVGGTHIFWAGSQAGETNPLVVSNRIKVSGYPAKSPGYCRTSPLSFKMGESFESSRQPALRSDIPVVVFPAPMPPTNKIPCLLYVAAKAWMRNSPRRRKCGERLIARRSSNTPY